VAQDVRADPVEEDADPQDEARRRLALAQVRQYPDPALRLRAHEVEAFDDDLQRLVQRMTGLMQDAHGVGLAATQVGVLERLFVFQPGQSEPRAIVNPEIVERSPETDTDNEGCLSLQGVMLPVERSTAVTLAGFDPAGTALRLELTDHAARVAQHELDHLDGVLIVDRTTPEARKAALAILRPRLAFS
jgi:peptide deformylase